MLRTRGATVALGAVALVVSVVAAAPASAQRPQPPAQWNDARTRDLVERATARRAQQLADTGLVDYKATAHGYLTFLAQVGEGLTEPPKVVKADQLALEVYWHAPDMSKQRIVGRRDTLLLPTDINYHRDHLGIVQNNFPNAIRLGEGDEVLDVPHPLSAAGLEAYDYAISDSLQIRLPDRKIDVIEVRVRPKDDTKPRAIGAVYIDRDEAQVVRMAFSFTRAALRDKDLEDVSVVLENALVGTRFWLPRRQEIEIRRTGTWLDFPARGIIRGRWEIGDYAVNQGLALAIFGGPELTFLPPEQRRRYAFGGGSVLDSLPADVRMVTDEDVRRVQAQARALVQQQVLARTRSSALAARRISDFARVNRVEGLALGAGYVWRVGSGVSVTAQGRYGFDDNQVKGRLALAHRWPGGAALRLTGYRDFREAGDEPEVSLARNSLAAQEFGSDWTDPYLARGAELAADLVSGTSGLRGTLSAAYEQDRALSVHATPFAGRYEPTLPVAGVSLVRVGLEVERPPALGPLGVEWRLGGSLRTSIYTDGSGCGDAVLRPPRPESSFMPPPDALSCD
ncbi:MAG TPA: hypothetical protein VNS52_10575, partial [Gemmatimonadaceae bacterium]|nr:hypothetical protein [Gemmatimonadaceae bacterium]